MIRSTQPGAPDDALSAAQIEVLARANQLVRSNKPGDAATLFAELGSELQGLRPRRAANLHSQAAHAYADAGNEQLALAESRQALTMFIQYRMIYRTPVFFANITRKLNNKGMKNSSSALQKEFGSRVGPMPPPPLAGAQQAAARRRGALPTNCPKCGAPIRGDETNWIDEQTAECDYCGTAIRATA